MKFVLFRHAQKGLTPYADPELTPEGFQQATALVALTKQSRLPAPTQAWVSAKIRTGQTLKPVCDEYKVLIQISDLLDLRSSHETSTDFRKRVQKFLNELEILSASDNNQTCFACTHYDWIEEAMTLINCDKNLNSFEFSHWPPAQFIVFEIQNGTGSPWKYIRLDKPNTNKESSL